MKSLLLLPLLLVFTVPLAYAEIQDFTVQVDNERVHIIGESLPSTEIVLSVWNSSGNLVFETFYVSGLDGLFNISHGEKELQGLGEFTAELKHDGGIETFSFELVEPQPTLDIQMNDNAEISLVPQSAYDQLLQENNNLKNEISELKNEIESLKEQMQRMQEDFFLTIKQQLEYFMSLSNN